MPDETIRETAERLLNLAMLELPIRTNRVPALCHAVLAAPQWHPKPTGPGLWVGADGKHTFSVRLENLENWGFDDYRWYGPIPEGSDHA